jgi:hypothetical protein
MAVNKKPVVKPKSKLTGADITGQKYNTKIKEEAAKIRLKVRLKEKLTPYEKSVLGSDAAIKKMNTKPAATSKPKVTPKPKGLNDYLDKGQTPPSRNKKLPSDADVILKGYNDKKTIAKLKNKKSK